ncbi:putative hemerythrin-like protein C869,06c OS=Schizosaccharomyces pombe (strain 972 / ATCC 24843) GN=SPAC869.06c PE=3 SV=1 [Rhizoctonia solani AG-1 IB]|uniref:Putative hemerythrin-like protein C869,06c n=1 Tax=Thanatephorus cucumeris (strain AG1-IB / isolate 7/3/14) TaxID=1108050 RepID=A0A0B7FDC3_THACB|nr:putative hemerythrin-like protein C869,06c OS=Schizosaccharomyces pombe (strain 972 / ATCC 24843) GN=SPAC869.06c PE=3 SV=1 [Rhizoctonia solani AG-1 IB]
MISRVCRATFNARLAIPQATLRGPGDYFRRSIYASTALRLDYFDEVMVDHNNLRDLHSRFIAAYEKKNEEEMTRISHTFIREAALHSDGEELSIYKTLDQKGLNEYSEKDREDHQKVKQALKHIDSNSISSLGIMEYANAFERAAQLLFTHADEEEKVHYKKLSSALSDTERANLAIEFLKARSMAPTRPHPSAPQHGGLGQKLMGGMAKPVDAAVNAMRDHVTLKYEHASI